MSDETTTAKKLFRFGRLREIEADANADEDIIETIALLGALVRAGEAWSYQSHTIDLLNRLKDRCGAR